MVYFIGLLTGLVIAVLILASVAYFRVPLERTINRTKSIINKKGEILEPMDNEVKDWLDKLPIE